MIRHNQYVSHLDDFRAAGRALRSGWVAPGPEVKAIEHDLAVRFGRPCCVVSSGTAALYLAIKTFGIYVDSDDGARDRVEIPSYACSALSTAVTWAGGEPALCDVDPATFNARRRPSNYAVGTIAVHTYGVPMDASGCLIEDITHAIGATWEGKQVGTLSRLAVCSMGPTKLLSSPGGGFILGNSDEIEECRKRRDALNLTMSDLHAAIARERLKRLDEEIAIRQEIADLYDNSWDGLRPNTWLGSVKPVAQGCHGDSRVWYRYVIRVKDWRKAQDHFARRGIETINPLRPDELLHRQLGLLASDFPSAEEVAATTLSLPIYPSLTSEERQRVADALSELEE